ncbi:GMC oxidoreductase [Podospora fimiseda]|uniref:GMC oxidoreductase n=1 Tax=Podospora fimiseda TaxID=252190 RepID=A0AAN7BIT6_9PEZI|nr:GMC oxidoreductase [Podospora fimiseda]
MSKAANVITDTYFSVFKQAFDKQLEPFGKSVMDTTVDGYNLVESKAKVVFRRKTDRKENTIAGKVFHFRMSKGCHFNDCFLSFGLGASATGDNAKRHVSELNNNYDFIIVGGGTSGLTVANRVSAAFPSKSVLVVEFGEIVHIEGQFDPPSTGRKTDSRAPSGQLLGGCSAVNGQFFDRGSKHDYDTWTEVAGPDFAKKSGIKWDWKGIYPSFKKSATFTTLDRAATKQYGYTWHHSAYSNDPKSVQATLPPFQWADIGVKIKAFKEMGLKAVKDCANGEKNGICWVTASQHPVTAARSHSGIAHYANVQPRANYHLLLKHQAVKVIYPRGVKHGPPIVQVRNRVDNTFANLTAKAEVILAAGALNTPIILKQAVSAKHLSSAAQNIRRNATFKEESIAQFYETPAKGPYTLAFGNNAVYVSLPKLASAGLAWKDIVSRIKKSVLDNSFVEYLPVDLRNEKTIVSGYKHQLLTLAKGTVRLNVSSPGLGAEMDLIMDYRAGTNPVDWDLHRAHLRYLISDTPTYKALGGVEWGPGKTIAKDDELLRQFVINGLSPHISFAHPCCTAAMLPEDRGGFVGVDLKVHGARSLRVVDLSVMPLILGSHTSSTAYAVGRRLRR